MAVLSRQTESFGMVAPTPSSRFYMSSWTTLTSSAFVLTPGQACDPEGADDLATSAIWPSWRHALKISGLLCGWLGRSIARFVEIGG